MQEQQQRDKIMSSAESMHQPEEQYHHQYQQRTTRHQPVKIHSIITSSHSGFNLSRISPPSSYSTSSDNLFASSPITATTISSPSSYHYSYHHSQTSASSSVSTSYPPVAFENRRQRLRADSTAAREAMESAIQVRLDRIVARLDTFNVESAELYARTQALAKVITEKSKRLYRVEDHLLRIQGKPGLSENFIENDGTMSRRRLTNDLEELHMGVKTLRKKFQVAGSVVATVGWWRHLKDKKDQLQQQQQQQKQQQQDEQHHSVSSSSQGLYSPTSESPHSPVSPLGRSLSQKKEERSLQNIFIAHHDADADADKANSNRKSPMPTAAQPFFGLRSPPLTPKGPLAGSSLSSLQDHHPHQHHSSHHKSRPLSIIPDLDESSMIAMGLTSPVMTAISNNTTTVMMADLPPSFPLIDDALLEKLTLNNGQTSSSTEETRGEEDESDRRTEEFVEGQPALVSSSSSTLVTPTFMEMFSAPTASASEHENINNRDNFSAEEGSQQQQPSSQQEHVEQDEDDEWEAVENEPESSTGRESNSIAPDDTATAEKHGDADEEPPLPQETSGSLAEIDITDSIVLVKKGITIMSQEQSPIPDNKTEDSANEKVEETNSVETEQEQEQEQEQNGWVQTLWRFLIRAEYFFLGTAVLGAFMPENWWALCAGFISAVMYGLLVIRTRFLSSSSTTNTRPDLVAQSDRSRQGWVPPQSRGNTITNIRKRCGHAIRSNI
ncbi:hypothetical protein BGZ83_000834 [Gryganskiella cystojenkinii]|nr:hypothetical protein BGZ83_000834 [Gryganskiella cystojenkinii]